MRKKRLLVGLCSWNNPRLLKKCIESLIDTLDLSKDGVAVVLNEADQESMSFLKSLNISFVAHSDNRGAIAIDYLKPFVENSEYFMNVNDDMFFSKGFSEDIISIIQKYYPATASCRLIENFNSGNPVVIVDPSIDSIYNLNRDVFEKRCEIYRFMKLDKMISYNHPIACISKDFLKIGGYTANWREGYESGYARDDAFAVELLNLNSSYKFICSNNSFSFHQSSETNKRLPGELRRSNEDSFQRDY
ncbi:MAG: hypothetical protein RLZ10_2568, partial [Bacteroidota bacterium]